MKNKKITFYILVIIIILVCVVIYTADRQSDILKQERLISTVDYSCDNDKIIIATYYKGTEMPVKAGDKPVPTGKVEVSFDGAPIVTLSQTISGSGVRYISDNESIVFWSKGDEVTVTKNDAKDFVFENCKTN